MACSHGSFPGYEQSLSLQSGDLEKLMIKLRRRVPQPSIIRVCATGTNCALLVSPRVHLMST